MKKISLAIITCLICEILLAQPVFKRGCRLGIKTGAAFTAVAGSRRANIPKIGFAGGLWLQLKLDKKWTAMAEVLFVEKGTGRRRNTAYSYSHPYSISSQYFEVPLLLRYHQEDVAFEFGPGFGYLANAAEFSQGSPVAEPLPFYRRELSFSLGLIYTFKDSWSFGCRYSNSIIPIRKGSPLPEYWQRDLYNCVLSLTLAHQLKIRRPKDRSILPDEA